MLIHEFLNQLDASTSELLFKITGGAFHLAKIFGITGWNANGALQSTGNFPEQTDNLRSYVTFSVLTGWSRNYRAIWTKFPFLPPPLQTRLHNTLDSK